MKDYVEKVIRTASPDYFDTNHNIQHGIEGIVTECCELLECYEDGNRVELIEEIGDICWYMALICNEYKITFDTLKEKVYDMETYHNSDMSFIVPKLCVYAGKIMDASKRAHFYKKENGLQESKVLENLSYIYSLIEEACATVGTDLDHVQDVNIKKLTARYPEKFNADQATFRNVENERKVLEENVHAKK